MTLAAVDSTKNPETEDVGAIMRDIGARARAASRALALASSSDKDGALANMAQAVRDHAGDILAANAQDLAAARAANVGNAFLDRLTLTDARLEGIAAGIEAVAALADPVGRVLATWERPNGLQFERVSTPIGVIGIVYESRPNVTADAGALTLKSGNAAILRGGSDSFLSSRALANAMREALAASNLPEDAIQLVPTRSRDAVGLMLRGLDGNLDVMVPRGGRSLVERVQAEARVPVFSHLDGNCHIYVHGPADLGMVRNVVLNAKMRRTGVCGAVETLLVDRAIAETHLVPLVEMLLEAGCEVRGDEVTRIIDQRVVPVTEQDWATEFLDAIIAVGVVEGLDGAIAHINSHGSHHTDAILTDDAASAERFLNEVDSAVVLHNASTQFSDGGEFGFGAEIGIATGRLHARGPVGVEQLTTFKYRVRGAGQIRA